MSYTTLLDIAKANGSDPVTRLIDETTKAHPELTLVPARTIKGISYKTWVRKGLPVTGFRNANEGAIIDKSQYENRLVDTYIFNPRIQVDKAVADAYEDGPAAYISYEMGGIMESSMQLLGRQFYYGKNQWTVGGVTYGGDPKGFPGLIDGYSTTYQTDATGTTANTASSVWGIKFGEQYVQWVWGNLGSFTESQLWELPATAPTGGGSYTAYIQEILARPGLQIGNIRGVGRIKNLTADTGKGLTDAVLATWLAQFEVGYLPDVIVMSRRSRMQLQTSRTVTLFGQLNTKTSSRDGGQGLIAPTPTAYDGIPIVVTDSIQNTEAIS